MLTIQHLQHSPGSERDQAAFPCCTIIRVLLLRLTVHLCNQGRSQVCRRSAGVTQVLMSCTYINNLWRLLLSVVRLLSILSWRNVTETVQVSENMLDSVCVHLTLVITLRRIALRRVPLWRINLRWISLGWVSLSWCIPCDYMKNNSVDISKNVTSRHYVRFHDILICLEEDSPELEEGSHS